MSSVYLSSINRLIQKRGNSSLSLRSVSSSGIDPNDPTKPPTTTTTDVALLSYEGRYKAHEMDGTLIKEGDIKLYVDPTDLAVTPKTDDKVTDGSTSWSIKNIKQWKDKDTIVLYVFQLRK